MSTLHPLEPSSAAELTTAVHPLEPLNAAEVASAVQLLKGMTEFTATTRIVSIMLKEPVIGLCQSRQNADKLAILTQS